MHLVVATPVAPNPSFDLASGRLATDDGDGVTREETPVDVERPGDGDASHRLVVLSDAASSSSSSSSEFGAKGKVEDMVTSEQRSSVGQELPKTGPSELHEEDKGGVLTAIRIMLSTPHTASFFVAVGLSGTGAGVIDTFLFIR